MIYFLHAPSVNLVKIGTSENPERRFQEIRLMSPVPCNVFATFSGGYDVEALIHQQFKEYHSHGEWFHAVKPLMTFGWRRGFEHLIATAPDQQAIEWAKDRAFARDMCARENAA